MELCSPNLKFFCVFYNPNLKTFPSKKVLIFFPEKKLV